MTAPCSTKAPASSLPESSGTGAVRSVLTVPYPLITAPVAFVTIDLTSPILGDHSRAYETASPGRFQGSMPQPPKRRFHYRQVWHIHPNIVGKSVSTRRAMPATSKSNYCQGRERLTGNRVETIAILTAALLTVTVASRASADEVMRWNEIATKATSRPILTRSPRVASWRCCTLQFTMP